MANYVSYADFNIDNVRRTPEPKKANGGGMASVRISYVYPNGSEGALKILSPADMQAQYGVHKFEKNPAKQIDKESCVLNLTAPGLYYKNEPNLSDPKGSQTMQLSGTNREAVKFFRIFEALDQQNMEYIFEHPEELYGKSAKRKTRDSIADLYKPTFKPSSKDPDQYSPFLPVKIGFKDPKGELNHANCTSIFWNNKHKQLPLEAVIDKGYEVLCLIYIGNIWASALGCGSKPVLNEAYCRKELQVSAAKSCISLRGVPGIDDDEAGAFDDAEPEMLAADVPVAPEAAAEQEDVLNERPRFTDPNAKRQKFDS